MEKLFYGFTLMVLVLFAGCNDMTSLQNDPNRTTQATPDLLLTNIEESAFAQISANAALASRYLTFTNSANSYQYYTWQRAGFGTYNNMRQIIKMKQAAKRTDQNSYLALAKFFNSFYIVQLSQTFGDVPYGEALQGEGGDFKPAYDRQQKIYLKVLSDLQQANQMLSDSSGNIRGDIIYNGHIQQWQKLINSFSLRVLISLSHKTGNADLQIKNRFSNIISDPQTNPVITSNGDNGALPYYDKENNRYPYYNNNDFQTAYYMEKTFVDKLKKLNDPRLFSFAAQKPNAADQPADSFNSYGGLQGSAPLGQLQQKQVSGAASGIAERYYHDPINEPSIMLSYAETEFNISEAIQRGWISGDVQAHYQKGIRASMQFYGIADTTVDNYLQYNGVALESGQQLRQILTQKYIAFYMNSGFQPFYNQRRTGIPEFDVSGSGVGNNGRVPQRWMYPESELQNNTGHVKAAINQQYPGGDNINATMWLLKNE